MDLFYATLGLVILLLAGDSLVRGAVNVSLRLGVPTIIVSLTIVAFGTSAPELLVSVSAVLDGAPGLALGNVVGSNVANILLVLGVPAMIAGIATGECDTRATYLQMLGATLLFIVLAFTGRFGVWQGLVLLAGLAAMLAHAYVSARGHRRIALADACELEAEAEGVDEFDEVLELADPQMPWWKIFVFLALGLVGLPLGAQLLVDASTSIAREMGVSETVIGLTLVAFGTSLPELATSVMAAIRRHADVALGNVIGSNMFNLLAIIGISSLVGPIPVEPGVLHFDLWVMLGAALLLAPFVFLRWHLGRVWGVLLTALYIIYVAAVL